MIQILFNYILSALLSVFLMKTGSNDVAPKIYPVPPANDNSLFYLQRTKNTNAIVYEVNRKSDGTIDEKNPVKIFWIRYASDSTTADLTYIQTKYAYGLNIRPYNSQTNAFVTQLVSYKKKNIFILPAGGKRYASYTNINGKLAELKKIFVQTSGGSFWFPKVDYIELSGKDPSTQKPVVERFVP